MLRRTQNHPRHIQSVHLYLYDKQLYCVNFSLNVLLQASPNVFLPIQFMVSTLHLLLCKLVTSTLDIPGNCTAQFRADGYLRRTSRYFNTLQMVDERSVGLHGYNMLITERNKSNIQMSSIMRQCV